MTDREQKTLRYNGCIAITMLELGVQLPADESEGWKIPSSYKGNANAYLENSFSSPEAALAYKTKLENENPGKKVVMFGLQFYSPTEEGYRPDANGKVNMSDYHFESKGQGYTNFDYGLYDATRGGRYWHADGGETPGSPMNVFLSTYNDFIKPDETNSLNRTIFAVKIVE